MARRGKNSWGMLADCENIGYTRGQRMHTPEPRRFLRTEPLLGAIALILLLLGCFLVLRHFLTALVWAIILTYSLFPLQKLFTRWFRGRRTLAACLVTLTVAAVVSGPVVLIGMSLAKDGRELAIATRAWFMDFSETPPAWVEKVPIVGLEVDSYWKEFSRDRKRWMDQLEKEVKTTPPRPKIIEETADGVIVREAPPVTSLEPPPEAATPAREESASNGSAADDSKPEKSHMVALLGRLLTWARSGLLDAGIVVLGGVTQILISAFLAFFLLRDSDQLSKRLTVAVEHLAGDRARRLLKVAGDTVRGVIFGILGTALAQALLAGVGFWVAGVPGAVLLAVLTFLFAVLPFGPPMIWVPASLWLFAQGKPGYGLFMALWGLLAISSVDNFLRPYLISQGNNMPYALVFCGLIGGALAFGLVGIFLGPIILAVAFRLVDEWSTSTRHGESEGSAISELPSGT